MASPLSGRGIAMNRGPIPRPSGADRPETRAGHPALSPSPGRRSCWTARFFSPVGRPRHSTRVRLNLAGSDVLLRPAAATACGERFCRDPSDKSAGRNHTSGPRRPDSPVGSEVEKPPWRRARASIRLLRGGDAKSQTGVDDGRTHQLAGRLNITASLQASGVAERRRPPLAPKDIRPSAAPSCTEAGVQPRACAGASGFRDGIEWA